MNRKTRRVIALHPEAALEITEAQKWYAAESPRLASNFLSQVDLAFGLIVAHPLTWPRLSRGVHRYFMHRFPYSIVYRVRRTEIQVVAVAHGRRRPGYWKRR